MLEGILVDLVPYGETYFNRIPEWENSIAAYWGSAGDRPILSKATGKRWYQEWVESLDKRGDQRIEFGVQTKDGTPIGQMGINWMSPTHRWANLGALIGEPDYWGGGYGTDGFILLVDYLFNWLNLRRIYIGTMESNVRVQRMMEKVGFVYEGRHRGMWFVDGAWQDDLIYGLLCDEWPGRAALVEKLNIRPR
ncbi:MAG TPA: GNAT family protein [Aggregatilinea sp.]|jgi:RimJ/RimL family protein N-acetyltransferase|uniref:GNAT family N-acetyltransferase n=1 Tax=Aggregatilinea sp. TaxID=2806333 RepID=UPI002C4F59E6|nr:GNAT family protein [Aggregatilinea sp.]HML24540.1 GNAT family protein [Aggregatilinea sp.]